MYKSEINLINNMYATSDYIKCLQKCFSLVKGIDKRCVDNYPKLFNLYYKISFIYSILSLENKAIFYWKKAFIYVTSCTERAKLSWTLSCIYQNISKWKAIKYINDAIKEYNEIGDFSLFCQASLHKAFLLNDDNTMLLLIKDLKQFNLDSNRMDLIYKDLIEVYINKNQVLKAQSTLLKIKNFSIKNKLRTKIYSVCAER